MLAHIACAARPTEVTIDPRQVSCAGSDLKAALMAVTRGQEAAIGTHAARDLANAGDRTVRRYTLWRSPDAPGPLVRGTQAETPARAVSCASGGKASMS